MNVRTLCLGALIDGAATGYEIKKLFEEGYFSFFQQASLGSIYPALTKLSEEGLVTFSEEQQAARPDKKIYAITPAGRAEFSRSLMTTKPGDDQYRSDTVFMLCFSHMLPSQLVGHLLDDYYQRQVDELTRLDAMTPDCDTDSCDPGLKFVQGLGVTVHKAITEYIETHRTGFLTSLEASPEPVEKEPAA